MYLNSNALGKGSVNGKTRPWHQNVVSFQRICQHSNWHFQRRWTPTAEDDILITIFCSIEGQIFCHCLSCILVAHCWSITIVSSFPCRFYHCFDSFIRCSQVSVNCRVSWKENFLEVSLADEIFCMINIRNRSYQCEIFLVLNIMYTMLTRQRVKGNFGIFFT